MIDDKLTKQAATLGYIVQFDVPNRQITVICNKGDIAFTTNSPLQALAFLSGVKYQLDETSERDLDND